MGANRRIPKKDGVRIEKTFYPNGNVRAEVPYRGEHIDGITRYWHENGNLQSEIPMRKSVKHGILRSWDSTGKLLDESVFVDGTGVFRSFHDNGSISGEMEMRRNVPHGRQRTWDENGNLDSEAFFIEGRPTSRKRFEKAEQDSHFPVLGLSDSTAKANLIAALLKSESSREASAWAKDRRGTIGETYSNEDSIALIELLYDAGAEEVIAVNIDTDLGDIENTGQLAVKLPTSEKSRKRLVEICNAIHRNGGYAPELHNEQEYVLLVFD